jgi:phage tail-like protein
MRVEGFNAVADIVGRRVKLSWDVVLDAGEGLDKAPRITLRRKQRDFEFVAAASVGLVYDSAAFPASTTVTEVDLGETRADGLRTSTLARSVSRRTADVSVEVLRHTRAISFDAARRPVRYREEVVDVDQRAEGLVPGIACYYMLTVQPPAPAPATVSYAVATPTEMHRSGKMMYELLPAIVRRHDVTKAPVRNTGSIPEAPRDSGQLRRFVDLFGTGLDHLRSRADGLRDLHEVDTVDHRMLEHLAATLGWDLAHDKSIPIQRHEIKYAAALYRVTGTLPGCLIWVRRLSGWDAEFKEMWRSVFFTNDVRNPLNPADNGSYTLDTTSRPRIDAMGTRADTVDYVCETGSASGVRYAMDRVAIFVTTADVAADIDRKRARIINGAGLFLPFNLHPTVVVNGQWPPR